MARVRISTTVDAQRLTRARHLLAVSDSQLVERALVALIDELETQRELAALEAHPYDEDPDLDWETPTPTPLPYDGEVPEEVQALADERRRE